MTVRSVARLDVFEDTASNNVQPYLRPQETGNRTGVRDLTLFDHDEKIRFSRIAQPLEVSVLPYSFEQLEEADHQEELGFSTGTYVRIASEHMGVRRHRFLDDADRSARSPERLEVLVWSTS